MSEAAPAPKPESLEHDKDIAWKVALDIKPIMDGAIVDEKAADELEASVHAYEGDDEATFAENERFNGEAINEANALRKDAVADRQTAKDLAELYAQDYHDDEELEPGLSFRR